MHSSRRFVVASCAATLVYIACFYFRLDYSAHLLVGCGLAGIIWVVTQQRGMSVGVACLSSISAVVAVGFAGELTVFGPTFDWVDVSNAAIGAVLATATLAANTDHGPRRSRIVLASVAMIIVGWLLRYPISDVTTQWWWRA